jgi:hypothetical protein
MREETYTYNVKNSTGLNNVNVCMYLQLNIKF